MMSIQRPTLAMIELDISAGAEAPCLFTALTRNLKQDDDLKNNKKADTCIRDLRSVCSHA